MNLGTFFQTTTLISAIFSIILILLQQRGATLGAGFGGSGELFLTRRGLEKSIFRTTVVFALVFVFSILGMLLIPS